MHKKARAGCLARHTRKCALVDRGGGSSQGGGGRGGGVGGGHALARKQEGVDEWSDEVDAAPAPAPAAPAGHASKTQSSLQAKPDSSGRYFLYY